MVEIGRQPRRTRALLTPIIVLAIIAVLALALAPAVVSIDPPNGTVSVPTGTSIEIDFSRVMDEASVSSRLDIAPAMPVQTRWEGTTLIIEPEGLWPSATQLDVTVRPGARSRLGIPMLFGTAASFTTIEPSLLYLQDTGAGPALYRLGLDGGEPAAVLPDGIAVVEFALGAQGQLAVLERSATEQVIRVRQLAQPAEPTLSIPCSADRRCTQIAISPDGAWLAWVEVPFFVGESGVAESRGSDVWIVASDGESPPLQIDPGLRLRSPQWIDSTKLAAYAVETGQLALYLLVGDTWERTTLIENALGEQWTWSPDGRFVVFPEIELLDRPLPGTDAEYFSHLIRVEAGSGLRTDLSGDSAALLEDASPAYSPDGLQLAFARRSLLPGEWTPGRQLWLMRADGGGSRPLTDDSNKMHTQIVWRPDGAGLAYVVGNLLETTSVPQLVYFDFAAQQSTLLVDGGYAPLWIQ